MKKYYYTILLCVSLAAAALWQLRPGASIYTKLPQLLSRATAGQVRLAETDGTGNEASPQTLMSDAGSSAESMPAQESNDAASQTGETERVDTGAAPDSAENGADTAQQTAASDEQPGQSAEGAAVSGTGEGEAAERTNDDAAAEMPLPPADFSGVLMIGDSRTVGLSEYGDLGQADVFASTGLTVFKLFQDQVKVKDLGQVSLEELLTARQYQMIYLMLGINEIGYPEQQLVGQYRAVVEKIRSLQPGARLVLSANLHVTEEKSAASTTYNNSRIDALNAAIRQMAGEENCSYIDPNRLFDDGKGNLAKEYSSDGAHPMGKYYARWSQWLKDGVI